MRTAAGRLLTAVGGEMKAVGGFTMPLHTGWLVASLRRPRPHPSHKVQALQTQTHRWCLGPAERAQHAPPCAPNPVHDAPGFMQRHAHHAPNSMQNRAEPQLFQNRHAHIPLPPTPTPRRLARPLWAVRDPQIGPIACGLCRTWAYPQEPGHRSPLTHDPWDAPPQQNRDGSRGVSPRRS